MLSVFVYITFKQISQTSSSDLTRSPQEVLSNYTENLWDNPNDKYVNPTKYDQPLPLINRSAPKSDVEWAKKFLRMPTWSSGYNNCETEHSEVSCYELHRSAKIIERWENAVKSKKTLGTVFVNVSSSSINFPDKLSMIYHGFQIAITTNRELVTDRKSFEPISLPAVIRNPTPNENHGKLLESNHLFACSDISERNPKIYFTGASWPQVLYTHPVIAPQIRQDFGYHAAHIMGNYLFGQITKPENECSYNSPQTVIEGWVFAGDKDMLLPHEYDKYIPRCGINSTFTSLVTNELNYAFMPNQYQSIFKFNESNPQEVVCALRRITSAKKIVQTFGSRLGFWATALQGSKASFVNGIDKICTNLTNSQQGSLWHTFCPYNKKDYLYRTNNYFFLCGNNLEDANSYIKYLLW